MKGSLDPKGSAEGIWRDTEEEKADAGAKNMFQGQEKAALTFDRKRLHAYDPHKIYIMLPCPKLASIHMFRCKSTSSNS